MTDTTPRVMALESCTLLLRPDDHVAVDTRDLQAGTVLRRPDGSELVVTQGVPRGHKLAVRGVETGGAVRKYGQSIGRATAPVAAGDHVHTHNLGMADIEHEYDRLRAPDQPSHPDPLRNHRPPWDTSIRTR